jgi:hypothetical protein
MLSRCSENLHPSPPAFRCHICSAPKPDLQYRDQELFPTAEAFCVAGLPSSIFDCYCFLFRFAVIGEK